MKFDWSKILVATMVIFILMIVGMGIKMATSNQSLYEEDYYEKGEDHAHRMVMELESKWVSIKLNQTLNQLDISFDSAGFVETIWLVNLADIKQDKKYKFTKLEPVAQTEIRLGQLKPGAWVIEVTGMVNGQAFFKKQQLAL